MSDPGAIRRRRASPVAGAMVLLGMVAYVVVVGSIVAAALLLPFALLRYVVG
jgi:hypothetical protein